MTTVFISQDGTGLLASRIPILGRDIIVLEVPDADDAKFLLLGGTCEETIAFTNYIDMVFWADGRGEVNIDIILLKD